MKKLSILSIMFFLTASILYTQWQPDYKLTAISYYTYSLQNNSKQVAAYGNVIHTVWYDNRDGNLEIYYKRSTDAGVSWGADTRITNASSNSEKPGVIAIGDIVHVAWNDLRDGDWSIYYKRSTDGGLSWSADQRLSNQPSNGFNACLAGTGNMLHVVWQDSRNGVTQNGYETYYKRSTDAGVTWGADIRMTNNVTNTLIPSISASGQFVHIVWYDTPVSQQATYYMRSTDQGLSWNTEIRLSSNAGASNWPCISSSGEFVHVVWTDTRDVNYEIYYKRSSDNGTSWGADTRLTNTIPNSYFPSVASSGGIVHVTWWDQLNVPVGNSEIYYKRSTNNGTSWETDIRLTNDDSYSRYTSVAASGTSAHVVWCDWRDGIGIWYKRDPTGNLIPPVNPPALVSPPNYSLNQPLTPLLNWDSVEYASAFRVQVSTDSLFGTSQFDTTTALSQIGVPAGKFSTGQKYFWRARGANIVGDGPWSAVWNFSTVPPPPSGAPVLVSPPNNSIQQPLMPLLNWDTVANVLTFRACVSTDSLFGSTIFDTTLTSSQVMIPPGKLTNNIKYFWKVRASNPGGDGPWSAIWNFTTIPFAPASAPNLIAPPNNSNGLSVTPLMDWDSLTTAAGYRIRISADSLFASACWDTSGLINTQVIIPAGKLDNDIKYYWQVKGLNPGGEGPWSVIWNFTTALTGTSQIGNEIPKEYKLYNNYPNPFNPVTKIKFDIPLLKGVDGRGVLLTIFDILGKEVTTLVNEHLKPGRYEVTFDGSMVASGIYFYQLRTNNYIDTKKLVLLK